MTLTQAEAPKQSDPPLANQPSDILIAEDDALLAASLSHNVRELGYHVIGPASNGEEAIALAKTDKPDLALMDIRMPIINGLGAATVLFKHMGIPVVIISAHCDPEYLDAGKRVGVFGYLVKPVTADQIRVNIEVAWSRFQQQEQLRHEVQGLKVALEDRKFIERAKGMLMDRLGLGENEAMSRLKKQARDSRRRLSDLARALVESERLLYKGTKKI